MPNFTFFKTASIALGAAALVETLARRRVPRAQTWVALFFAAAGWRAIRNFQLFAVFALPALVQIFSETTAFRPRALRFVRNAAMALAAAAAVLMTVSAYRGYPLERNPQNGIGLADGVLGAADFIRLEKLRGPIFNNYDIGGYLIYTLWPDEKVFVDNRPEAYPASFFTDVLVPAQEKDERWRELDAEYRFNMIVFSYHDLTAWAQEFMVRRLDDPEWAPVFADAYTIIFLRRTGENYPVIVRRELPRSMFRVISNT